MTTSSKSSFISFAEELAALVVGGWADTEIFKTTEIISQSKKCSSISFASLPINISGKPSVIQTSNDEILLCGGFRNKQKCLELKNNQWQEHSTLKNQRTFASAVSMPGGIYIFGGDLSITTWEWLPSGTNQWQSGTTIIPGDRFEMGCAVKINDKDILLIGGHLTYKQVLKFNTNTKAFTNLGDVLNQERSDHACALYQDKVIITGGRRSDSSTEIINLNDLTTAYTTGNFVQARYGHGLVVVHVDNKPTVLAVGGLGNGILDSIEMWNPTNETWTMTSMKLTEPKSNFGILSLPTHLLCP